MPATISPAVRSVLIRSGATGEDQAEEISATCGFSSSAVTMSRATVRTAGLSTPSGEDTTMTISTSPRPKCSVRSRAALADSEPGS